MSFDTWSLLLFIWKMNEMLNYNNIITISVCRLQFEICEFCILKWCCMTQCLERGNMSVC